MEWHLADVFEAVVEAVAHREAVVAGDRRLTYADLDERATRLAAALAAQGLRPGQHLGLHLRNSSEYLEGMLAAFKLRAVPVNVNYRYVAAELRYLLADADVAALITESDLRPVVDAVAGDLPRLEMIVERGAAYEQLLDGAPPFEPPPGRTPDDRYILYTGGTTGAPKGVVWRHEDILFAALRGNELGVAEDRPDRRRIMERARAGGTRLLPACPFVHGTAHWLALSTLFSGGSVVVATSTSFSPTGLLDLIDREQVTSLVIVGDAFAAPLAAEIEEGNHVGRLTSLSVILSGGAVLSPSVKERLLEALPTTIVVDGYGASETGGQGSMVAAQGARCVFPPRFRVTEETTVLDERLRPVVPGSGVLGQLARRGHIPVGYYKDREKTAATFPVVDGIRWAIPGDTAEVLADGTILLYGRGSVSINTGGEKVFPEEVEVVLKGHPSVVDAVVVGTPDPRWGELVTAVVQLRPGTRLSLHDLTSFCRGALAGYKLPRALIVVDEVQRSESGKPDYRWARQRAGEVALAGG